MSHRLKSYILILISVFIWGASGAVIKSTLNYFDPVIFLTYRFFVTSLVLIPIILFFQRHTLRPLMHLTNPDWFYLIAGALAGTTIQLLLLFWGLSLTTSISGQLISSTSPILTALAGYWFLHDQITHREKTGLAIAFLGSIIIVLEPLLTPGQLDGNLLGNVLVLLGNVFWVIYLVISKKLLRHHLSPLLLTTLNFFIGFISMVTITLYFYTPYAFMLTLNYASLGAHLGVIYMAVFSGAVAYLLHQYGQRGIETSEADMFMYLVPVIATPLGYFFLHESITLYFLLGTAVIGLGVWRSATKPHPNHPR